MSGAASQAARTRSKSFINRTQADDALRLLTAVTAEPAYVFGSSSGAQIGLELAARHPGRVRGLVAHEPPANGLLPEGDPRRTVVPKIHSIYRSRGAGPAMLAFVEAAGLDTFRHPERNRPESAQAADEAQERLVRMNDNMDYFLSHVVVPAAGYIPDVAALTAGGPPVAVAAGDASEGQMAHATALALAEKLGVTPEPFPGGHAGFVTHPTGFARRLRQVIATT